MDCNKTKVFFDEWKRMCDYTDETCLLIQKGVSVGCSFCEEKVFRNADKAIEIVQEWSDAHPIKTRLSVFLEQYPNCRKCDSGEPRICVGSLYNFYECVYDADGYKDCVKCWNTPIEDDNNA